MSMRCSFCGNENEEGSRFCIYCGNPLPNGQPGYQQQAEYQGSPMYYQAPIPPNPYERVSEKPKKRVWPIVLFVSILAAAVIGLGTWWLILSGKKAPENSPEALGKAEEITQEETTSSTSKTIPWETTEEIIAETGETAAETIAETITAREELPYLSDTMTYPQSAADFTEVISPDGFYSFCYPRNFFKEGYYDPETKQYVLNASDGYTSLILMEMEAPIKNAPKECADSLLEQYRPNFVEGAKTPYIHQSAGVDETGCSRAIIGGILISDPTQGTYMDIVCNSEKVYILSYRYLVYDEIGVGADGTPTGYVMDCVYRGWSIGGSTYQLRTYSQYLANDMGSKR